jgi:hypothetical protein
MTLNDQLKFLVRKHRWALEELYFSEKMKEMNRFCHAPRSEQFRYLRIELGDKAEVLGACKNYLGVLKLKVSSGTEDEQLKAVARKYAWLFGEVAQDLEANKELPAAGSMFAYLRRSMSKHTILEVLIWLVRVQRQRRKTLALATG